MQFLVENYLSSRLSSRICRWATLLRKWVQQSAVQHVDSQLYDEQNDVLQDERIFDPQNPSRHFLIEISIMPVIVDQPVYSPIEETGTIHTV